MILRETGLYQGVAAEDYFRNPRVNISTLQHMDKAPIFYRHALLQKFEDTDALKLGRAYHIATLEPEKYLSRCMVWEDRRAGNAWEAFKEEHKGREILTLKENTLCLEIAKAVRADPRTQPYLNRGQREVSMAWTFRVPAAGALPGYEFECKGRLDFVTDAALIDLKGAADASPRGFERDSWKFHYIAKAAWYSDAYTLITGLRKPFKVVVVEKKPPFAVSIYTIEEAELEVGRTLYRGWLDRLNYCTTNSVWGSYFEGEQPLTIPRWTGFAPDEGFADDIDFPDAEQGAQ